jgi:prephenate dehydrogenase
MALDRIVIVGRGLIGGSIELAMRERGMGGVVALDRGDDLSAVATADLVVLSAPVRANLELLGRIREYLSPAALVTDTGSTKAAMHAAADGMRFIGGHPIAGAASGGRSAAHPDLFDGKPWVLTRGANVSQDDERHLEEIVKRLGASPHWMDASAHDSLFAFVSHLPQLAVSALMDVVGRAVGDERLSLAGPGLRDSTRLASSPPDVWADILSTNRTAIHGALDALIAALTRLRDDETGQTLVETFERAAAARTRLQDDR